MKIFLLIVVLILLFLPPKISHSTGLREWHEPTTGIEFVWIPAGSFLMGQTELEKGILIEFMGLGKYKKYFADNISCHKVEVDGFWIGKYEVTNAQYRMFVPKHNSGTCKDISLNGASQPVVEVTWNDAEAYAGWLSKKSGKKIRLPKETEWEYACRAGSKAIRYWGNDANLACAYANVADLTAKQVFTDWSIHNCSDGFIVSAPVGSFKPNNFGLYDTLGNVWEWCHDIYCGHKKTGAGKTPDDKITITNKYRVARGSCWDNPARYVRSASRNKRKPGYRKYHIGFRLLMASDPK